MPHLSLVVDEIEPLGSVVAKTGVAGDQRHVLCYGVGDDDVVGWVSVVLPYVETESCIGEDVLAIFNTL